MKFLETLNDGTVLLTAPVMTRNGENNRKRSLFKMNLEENEHILENKELKTNTQKRRFIAINNTTESSFSNGLVTLK